MCYIHSDLSLTIQICFKHVLIKLKIKECWRFGFIRFESEINRIIKQKGWLGLFVLRVVLCREVVLCWLLSRKIGCDCSGLAILYFDLACVCLVKIGVRMVVVKLSRLIHLGSHSCFGS